MKGVGELLRGQQMGMGGAGSTPLSFLESESKSNPTLILNTTYSSDLSPKKCFWISATLFFCPNCLPLTLLSALPVPMAGTPLSPLRKRKKDNPSCTSLRHGWRHSTWIRSHSPWAPSSLNWAVDRCLIENWDCENCAVQYQAVFNTFTAKVCVCVCMCLCVLECWKWWEGCWMKCCSVFM